ncbi:hypothetical protein C8R44DRAFT_728570 [Mycena epipterygia]|nr:hypothetical protein C8R44DRAFT_728570 [Mycena epipterygia]
MTQETFHIRSRSFTTQFYLQARACPGLYMNAVGPPFTTGLSLKDAVSRSGPARLEFKIFNQPRPTTIYIQFDSHRERALRALNGSRQGRTPVQRGGQNMLAVVMVGRAHSGGDQAMRGEDEEHDRPSKPIPLDTKASLEVWNARPKFVGRASTDVEEKGLALLMLRCLSDSTVSEVLVRRSVKGHVVKVVQGHEGHEGSHPADPAETAETADESSTDRMFSVGRQIIN